jgi:hypothetical protein
VPDLLAILTFDKPEFPLQNGHFRVPRPTCHPDPRETRRVGTMASFADYIRPKLSHSPPVRAVLSALSCN